MDDTELLEHWKQIILAVFTAEYELYDQLHPLLKEKSITPDEYITAIAKEILSKSNNNETN